MYNRIIYQVLGFLTLICLNKNVSGNSDIQVEISEAGTLAERSATLFALELCFDWVAFWGFSANLLAVYTLFISTINTNRLMACEVLVGNSKELVCWRPLSGVVAIYQSLPEFQPVLYLCSLVPSEVMALKNMRIAYGQVKDKPKDISIPFP